MNARIDPAPLRVGINLDGVLVHDGLPTPSAPERLAWVRDSGAFDYIEKNIDPREDFAPYLDWIDEYGVPVGVFGGIFCAGRDEATMRRGLATAGRLGARIFNAQLFARHADGHALSDREVADFFLEMQAHGEPVGCQPSLEVHVDMWSERFHRVERVAELLARSQVPLRITLDPSHLLFKIGLHDELAASGLDGEPDGGHALLAPDGARCLYRTWLQEGWVAHAHARSVAPGVPCNAAMERRPGVPGRAIQVPFVEPGEGEFHAPWSAGMLEPWKTALRDLIDAMRRDPQRTPRQISTEFIPFPDYGGGARYSIRDHNLACAAWLRRTWAGSAAA